MVRRDAPPHAGRRARALPPDAMLEQREPTHARTFRLAGEALLFECDDERVMELAAELFSRCGPPPVGGEPLRLRVVTHAPDSPAPLAARPVFRTQAHLFTVVLGAHDSAAADVLSGQAFAAVTPRLVADGPRLQQQVIAALALAMLGPGRGYVPFHCACLFKGDRGVLLHGPSGAGKSTLAYAAARRGYRVVSDDSVHVGGDGEARTWGLPWQLQLLPEAERFFPELARLEPRLQANGEHKLDLDLESLFPGSVGASGPVGPSLVLARRPGGTVIERLPDAEAKALVEPAWPWQVGWTERHEALLEGLLERGVYRFASGSEPDAMVDALDAFMEGPWD
ncbi:MAG TPA: hypothetical protein VF202_14700 [Trueperaceae bacterium]|jgi:hypothetical protein